MGYFLTNYGNFPIVVERLRVGPHPWQLEGEFWHVMFPSTAQFPAQHPQSLFFRQRFRRVSTPCLRRAKGRHVSARRAPQCAERPAGSLRSSLARHLPARPADEPQLLAMRRAAWLKEGIAVIRPGDLDDDWLRQTVINAATKLYGARRPEGGQGPKQTTEQTTEQTKKRGRVAGDGQA